MLNESLEQRLCEALEHVTAVSMLASVIKRQHDMTAVIEVADLIDREASTLVDIIEAIVREAEESAVVRQLRSG